MNAVTPLADAYLAEFEAHNTSLPGKDLDWLRDLRQRGIDTFGEIGFPTIRNENWKYTNVRALTRKHYAVAAPVTDITRDAIELPHLGDAQRLVFVNGVFDARLSSLESSSNVTVNNLANALAQTPETLAGVLGQHADGAASGFAALNDAFMRDGALIEVSADHAADKPIHIVFVAAPNATAGAQHVRNLLLLRANSQATVLESYATVGEGEFLSNTVTEAVLQPGAKLAHYKLQRESHDTHHVSTLQVRQDRDSRFESYSVSAGARLARNDINVVLDAPGAECALYGLYLADGRQHVDYHTRIDHRSPSCTSGEFYKGVLGGRSRAVFNGQVYVHPDAQKTSAEQSNRNLLLSPDAEVDTKPQLEIYADDVKCSHGATVGQLDDNMLFYLRARGISEEHARAMLTYGFAHDIVEQMPLQTFRDNVEQLLMQELSNAEELADITEVE